MWLIRRLLRSSPVCRGLATLRKPEDESDTKCWLWLRPYQWKHQSPRSLRCNILKEGPCSHSHLLPSAHQCPCDHTISVLQSLVMWIRTALPLAVTPGVPSSAWTSSFQRSLDPLSAASITGQGHQRELSYSWD